MAEPWFHHEAIPPDGAFVVLDPREAKHAAGARRLNEGDAVRLFDGAGAVAEAVIEAPGDRRRPPRLRIVSREVVPAPAPRRHLATALPKGDRLATLLNMATQLGLSSLTPLDTTRSVVDAKKTSADRWRRIMIEACKQSRRPHLPAINTPETLESLIAHANQRGSHIIVANPGGERLAEVLAGADADEILLVVGPEGGFTPDEIALLQRDGARLADLGSGTLRIETACIAMLAAAELVVTG